MAATVKTPAKTAAPLGLRVMVLPEEKPNQTAGGLYLPDNMHDRRKTKIGKVLSIGPGKLSPDGLNHIHVPVLKAGDRVLYDAFAGHDFEQGNVSLRFLDVDDVIAVLDAE
jgi:chaperonin GroES